MITISAMAFLMLPPLSFSVSTAGEALNLKLDYSLTNEKSTSRTKPYTDVIRRPAGYRPAVGSVSSRLNYFNVITHRFKIKRKLAFCKYYSPNYTGAYTRYRRANMKT